MNVGNFYFIEDKYIEDFPDDNIQRNHEKINGIFHDKPYFCALKFDEICWMVPISSKLNKYHAIEAKTIKRYKKCDGIKFYDVLGHKKAFLIQNMCPITDVYMKNIYIDSANGIPVRIDNPSEKELIIAAKKILNKYRHGIKCIFPDIIKIENILRSSIENNYISAK